MPIKALWTSEAVVELVEVGRAHPRDLQRIIQVVRRFERESAGDVKKLQGADNLWRIRAGDWRIVFSRDGDSIVIVAVSNRRDAY